MHLLTKLLTVCLMLPAISWALPSDREKPINIEADHAQMDDQEGVTQYKGDAILTQGTLKITGDIITFHYDENKQLTKAVSVGKLATYKQVHKPGEPPVKAKAIRMEYYADKQKIYLIGEGHVWQNGDEFIGNRIEYDIARNVVTANSAPVNVGGETHDSGRIHMIIQPMTQQKKDKPSQAKPKKVEAPKAAVNEPKPASQTETATPTTPKPAAEAPLPAKEYPEVITTSRLNVRTGPGTGYQRLGTLDQNLRVLVLTRQQGWAQIRGMLNGETVIGWVNDYYLQAVDE
ncbi:lipopolysaccharide transport periplasmic protein LptA [Methylophaga sp.]|uniref:lipopolysaccharide transport periplasmic protein LptA n=1 Tax=Methylophaga sp. TaxID=2024840 RepID=UPI003A91ECB2